MAEAKYQDLLIVNNDIALDDVGVPLGISDRASIAQDIKHMIRESGLLVELVGERDSDKVALNLQRLENLVETDVRIVPGTASITRLDTETFLVRARTQDYGHLEFNL
ncbi:DUF2590 family protein [Microbulbifer thermotolerans]|uniref:DUF2590 family protein n=1 Tax=Microbulbifer thermotolerans TaxID=252514 RepID=UPI00224A9D86|nr:DUF2590 family protein [Microbulbifer thermotolerans]MCX2834453.1 DUF2590 family protein [Microbulbifer thermotolerans]